MPPESTASKAARLAGAEPAHAPPRPAGETATPIEQDGKARRAVIAGIARWNRSTERPE